MAKPGSLSSPGSGPCVFGHLLSFLWPQEISHLLAPFSDRVVQTAAARRARSSKASGGAVHVSGASRPSWQAWASALQGRCLGCPASREMLIVHLEHDFLRLPKSTTSLSLCVKESGCSWTFCSI